MWATARPEWWLLPCVFDRAIVLCEDGPAGTVAAG
jgi:hypothetical protein